MDSDSTRSDPVQNFIDRWSPSGGSERSNYQLFLTELCELLEVPRPDPASSQNAENAYVFERAVPLDNRDGTTTTGFIDLYRRAHFVCETKQGVERQEAEQPLSKEQRERRKKRRSGHGTRGSRAFDDAMRKAYGQAANYARSLPASEGRPPLLMVVDVGHTIELYSEFSQTGGTYVAYPDPRSHKIRLADLADPEIRERLRLVWTDPMALDPARKSAAVTREIAAKLAELAKRLEADGHHAEDVAHFLMRCLFTMFAEDVKLLPDGCFEEMLRSLDDAEHFVPVVEDLWRTMNTGGFSAQLRKKLLYFNGGLFEDCSAIALTRDQLDLLVEAAEADWRDVEPAIFGTLLERALDPVERHKLGAHYTPRAYVERLVVPTVVEPLREEWDAARAAAATLAGDGETKKAVAELKKFHDRLCDVRVLDPACGSGNFLYVVLEHLKRIEGEVLADLVELGEAQQMLASTHNVDPHQLLGIEINPRAAAIAELVLWIGYLQWHFRTRGNIDPPEPVIRNFKNIECRDAVLDYTSKEIVLDDDGKPVTIWDGRTTKPHPVTGEEVPDETARVPMYKYLNPKKAEWPKADFVVGNPPFVGNKRMRFALGDGYVDALHDVYGKSLSKTIDFVMYWWHLAGGLATSGKLERFGFITTNSLSQSSNRTVLELHTSGDAGLSLIFAAKDHPWVDSADGANVRISMTVATKSEHSGELLSVQSESNGDEAGHSITFARSYGPLHADLTIGADVSAAISLASNERLSYMGMTLVGDFRISEEEYEAIVARNPKAKLYAKEYANGREVSQQRLNRYVIDFYGLEESVARREYPSLYQHVVQNVKPLRDQNKRATYKERWWVFGEPRSALREALHGLCRYIVTLETSKHRFFVYADIAMIPDHSLFAVAVEDSFVLGALSSRIHLCWCSAAGSTLEDRPRWRNRTCFDPFPFPDASESQKARIRELGEQLDAHRKRQQAAHPKLTMTGMYNVLEKLKSGEELTKKEKEIHEWGLVSVLKQIHDDLDAAVAEAYGWPVDLTDEEILERLVALNHERAEEEKRGIVRWLRPEFQNPDGKTQQAIAGTEKKPKAAKGAKEKIKKQKWPSALSEQAAAVAAALAGIAGPADEKDVAKRFTRANKARIGELLETLESLGKVRQLADGRYVAG